MLLNDPVLARYTRSVYAISYLSEAAFAKDRDKFKVACAKLGQIFRPVGLVFHLPEMFGLHVLGRFVDAVTFPRILQRHTTTTRSRTVQSSGDHMCD